MIHQIINAVLQCCIKCAAIVGPLEHVAARGILGIGIGELTETSACCKRHHARWNIDYFGANKDRKISVESES